jgi:hypothetical protein
MNVGRKEAAQGSRIGRKKRWPEEGAGPEKPNCNQGLKLNYRSVIHPTFESSMWIVKRSRFDEIFASTVSDRPSEQRFKKSNFWSTTEPLSNFFWCYTFDSKILTPLHWMYSCSNKFDPPFYPLHIRWASTFRYPDTKLILDIDKTAY